MTSLILTAYDTMSERQRQMLGLQSPPRTGSADAVCALQLHSAKHAV